MIQHLGKIEHLDIYWDPEMEHDQVLVGRKGKGSDPGIVFIPNSNMEMVEGVTMEPSEVDEILREQSKRKKFEDYNFIIGSFSTLDPYQKALNLIKNKR